MASKASGASNRQRQREAESNRRAEEERAPRRLAYLTPEQQEQARALMNQLLSGAIYDPDEIVVEPDDEVSDE